jgi:hypothetical protein
MTNYVQSTNFATKDALPSGDPLKIVKGTEINTEFNNIAVAVATKADTASPTFTGNVTGTFVGNITGNVTGNVTGNASTVTNGVYTTGNQTIGGEKTFSSTVYLADGGVMFNSDGARDTGISWASDGVMNVISNAVTVGQFNGSGFTGNAATATNATTAGTCTGNAATVTTVTTAQVLNATAGASLGAVGTYALLSRPAFSSTVVNPGDTIAGSNLRYAGGRSEGTTLSSISATAPSGTWRAMGFANNVFDPCIGSSEFATLFLRIS